MEKARRYIKTLRSGTKRKYAERYLAHVMGHAMPPPERDGLSYMAAQSVRMEIDSILEGEGHEG